MNKFIYFSLSLLLVSRSLADDLTPLSDEFENAATLSSWSRVYQSEGWGANQMESMDVGQTRDGYLTMVPRTSTWYRDWRGILMYKLVQGDFVVTMDVEPRNRAGTGAPNSSYSLAGVMVRKPRDDVKKPADWRVGGENYIFLSLGTGNAPGTYQFEVKSTINSSSSLEIDDGAPRALIQIVRIGEVFLVLRQLEGGGWEVHRRYRRPDLPATLQVGITVYTDWEPISVANNPFQHNQTAIEGNSPDLNAAIDYFRFRRPRVPSWLEGADFLDPLEVSDAEILQLFGDRSNRDPAAAPDYGLAIIDKAYVAGEGMRLEIESVPGYFYRAEQSADLENWSTVSEAEATSSSLVFMIPEATHSTGLFIRVAEE